MCMTVLDVKRAHFYARAVRRVFIEMPTEDPRNTGGDRTAELRYSLYGTQDAAANWENTYASALEEMGMRTVLAACQPELGSTLLIF